jgi:hypothetical protein
VLKIVRIGDEGWVEESIEYGQTKLCLVQIAADEAAHLA